MEDLALIGLFFETAYMFPFLKPNVKFLAQIKQFLVWGHFCTSYPKKRTKKKKKLTRNRINIYQPPVLFQLPELAY